LPFDASDVEEPRFSEPTIYPDELQARFGEKRFVALDPAYLDFEGAVLVLIGAEDEVRAELAVAVSAAPSADSSANRRADRPVRSRRSPPRSVTRSRAARSV
jgi:hypothetical protein